jgi:predicted RNA-binding protein with PUA-like domain
VRKLRGPKFWYIRHPFTWYKEHPNLISWNKNYAERNRDYRTIEKDDKVIYFSHEDPKGIVGLFTVVSKCYEHSVGTKPLLCYDIKPLYIPKGDEWPMKFSPTKDVRISLRPMGTIFELKKDQYRKIKSFLLGMNEPTNHEGVVTLFSKIHREIGYPFIRDINQYFPDAIVEDSDGKEKRIEFEFDSADFLRDMQKGKHDPKECDVIVCWKDSWGATRLIDRQTKRLKLVELRALYGS